MTAEEAHAFTSDHGKIQTKKAKTILAGVFNENKPNSPWTDLDVRRAANMAIDRQAIVNTAIYGMGTVIPAFIEPGRYGSDPSMKPIGLDIETASQVFERHGLKGREIVIAASPTFRRVADEIGSHLGKAGLTCRTVVTRDDPPDGWDIKLDWYFDWSPQYPVGVVHREFFGKGGVMRQAPEDPRFDALYDKLLHTIKQPAQEEVVKETERYIQDQAKCLFLFAPYRIFAVSNRVDFVAYDTCMSELAETKIKA